MPAKELRFDDLLNPVLNPAQQQMVDFANANPVDYTVDNVLAAARHQTGIEDPGPEGWQERLQVWIDVLNEPNRTDLARMAMFGLSAKFLANRMRIYDFVKRHPEVRDIEIKAPVMVMGLPRSGTSHLVNLLAADSRFRAAPLWELNQMVPAQGEGPGPDGVDPRFKATAEAYEMAQAANPYIKAWHPMDPWRIEEDIEIHAADFSGYYPEHLCQHAAQWRDYYLAHDQTPHYEFQKLCMQVMTWFRPRERWVTKYPAHVECIPALLNVFPDAILVETHRDPVGAVISNATMHSYMARTWQKEIDYRFHLDYWRDLSLRLLNAGMRDRKLIEDQVVDVYYDRLVADNWTAVQAVYDKAGIELTDQARAEIGTFIENNKQGRDGRVVYDLRGHFGVEPEEVREPFAAYLERHPVPIEVK
ncbi:sulfotransferase family protein [Sphaerimonospora thailandensis]|uniref:Putative sulfotransferase n=1 Tax=Sphaerimonospora thailandensis TaxID=795644 RepID=A0A8J3VXN0_9ACTN|nr:sulfotransferase [Sphaerimonospora thailandensis]GIH68060.1 putative sulfotransferase [Sphaerimonospora thailandensis]